MNAPGRTRSTAGWPVLLAWVVLAVLPAPACRTEKLSTPPYGQDRKKALQPRIWTRAFQEGAVLVADEIQIEGPADLLDHVVLVQDPEVAEYVTKTIPEGLLQQLTSHPDSGVEVRAQLDAWSMAAFRRLTVLQRPGEVPVIVRARGNAVWIPASGQGERRENELVFRGDHNP